MSEELLYLDEALTPAQRIKRKQILRKTKARRKRSLERNKKKLADTKTLRARAKRKARSIAAKKMTAGKDKSKLSYSARGSVEKRLKSKSGSINRMARKLMKDVRKKDREKFKHHKKEDTGSSFYSFRQELNERASLMILSKQAMKFIIDVWLQLESDIIDGLMSVGTMPKITTQDAAVLTLDHLQSQLKYAPPAIQSELETLLSMNQDDAKLIINSQIFTRAMLKR